MKNKRYFLVLLGALAWGAALLPAAVGGEGSLARGGSITGFTLVNADTDLDLFDLTPGQVLDMALLPTQNLNIRANTDAEPVGSVVFALSGGQVRAATENVAPYALFSDFQGDYFAWTPSLGAYTLLATPFDGPGGTGADGAPLTLSFTVINSVGAVVSYTLVNADTNLDIQPMTPGMTLDLGTLPTRNLNIRADTDPGVVGSVVFDLSGTQSRFVTENTVPYALFSDLNGVYAPWTPAVGMYTLVATPFAGAGGSGAVGAAATTSFTITGVPLPVQLSAFTAVAQSPTAVQLAWTTASEVNSREFIVQRSADGRVFTALGSVAAQGTTASPHAYRYTDQQLPATLATRYYRLQQLDTDGSSHFSPVRAVAAPAAPAVALQVYFSLIPDGLLHYAFTGPLAKTGALELYSLMGQRLGQYPLPADGVTGTIPVAGLAAGSYVLHLSSGGGRYAGRFVLP